MILEACKLFSFCFPNSLFLLRAFLFLAVFYLWVFSKVPGLIFFYFFYLFFSLYLFFFYPFSLKEFGLVGLLSNAYLQLLVFFKVNFTWILIPCLWDHQLDCTLVYLFLTPNFSLFSKVATLFSFLIFWVVSDFSLLTQYSNHSHLGFLIFYLIIHHVLSIFQNSIHKSSLLSVFTPASFI